MSRAIESPCVEVCQIRKGDAVCSGCFRTIEEIAGWGTMNPADRQQIMNELPARNNPRRNTP